MATRMQQAGIETRHEEAIVGTVQDLIARSLDAAGNQAAQNLLTTTTKMEELVAKMQSQQEEIKKNMELMNSEKELLKQLMEQVHNESQVAKNTLIAQSGGIKELNADLDQVKSAKDQIANDLVARNAEMNDMVGKLREASSEAFQRIRDSYGGIETTMTSRFDEVRRDADTGKQRLNEMESIMRNLQANAQASMGNTGGMGSDGGNGGGRGDEPLIHVKDVKLPILESEKPSVGSFRKWYKELYKYCSKRQFFWRGSETLFKVIRGYPNEIVRKEHRQFQQACTDRDNRPGGTHFDFSYWDIEARSREMFTCVEYALDGKCGDLVSGVQNTDGFELLRKLARKFDPISPQAASVYKGKIFALAGQPCANFAKTVERLHELDMLRLEMRENTGEEVSEVTLAEVYFPTMDASCQSEIVAIKIQIGQGEAARPVDIGKYEDLAEYVRERIHRERTLVPISPARMDVSAVEAAPQPGAQVRESPGQFGGQPAPSWSYDDPWDYGSGGNDLDALNKGKGKGKAKVIDCHRCEGKGHPQRMCPSPPNPDPKVLGVTIAKAWDTVRAHAPVKEVGVLCRTRGAKETKAGSSDGAKETKARAKVANMGRASTSGAKDPACRALRKQSGTVKNSGMHGANSNSKLNNGLTNSNSSGFSNSRGDSSRAQEHNHPRRR